MLHTLLSTVIVAFCLLNHLKFQTMAENNRNQDQVSGNTQQNRNVNQGNQTQKTSNQQQNQNPQRGSQWSNYQTREMSDEGFSGEKISGGESEEG
jgi:hypothetical protein